MNFTLETAVIFASTIPVFAASLLMLREYRNSHNRHSLLFFGGYLLLAICSIVEAVGYLLLEPGLIMVQGYLYIFVGVVVILALDIINSEKLDMKKAVLLAVVSTALVISTFDLKAVIPMIYPSGIASLMKSSYYRFMFLLLVTDIGVTFVYYVLKINYHAPPSLKKYSRINAVGGVFIGILTGMVYGLNLTLIFPGLVPLIIGIGTLFVSYAFYCRPALGYVLPFRAMKLFIVDTASGLCLFEYTWDTTTQWANPSLFTGLFQGLSSLTEEALQQGKLQEIRLERGVLLIQRPSDSTVYSILLTTRSSRYLRQALRLFTTKFSQRYSEAKQGVHDLQTFKDAKDIVMDAFPYIPRTE
jgi:hypothetical protein